MPWYQLQPDTDTLQAMLALFMLEEIPTTTTRAQQVNSVSPFTVAVLLFVVIKVVDYPRWITSWLERQNTSHLARHADGIVWSSLVCVGLILVGDDGPIDPFV